MAAYMCTGLCHLLTGLTVFTRSLFIDDDLAILRARSELDKERTSSLEELRLD